MGSIVSETAVRVCGEWSGRGERALSGLGGERVGSYYMGRVGGWDGKFRMEAINRMK